MKRDTKIGIGFMLVALFFMYNTGSIKIPNDLIDPGPRVLPYIAEIMMIICGGGMVYESLKEKTEEKEYLSKEGWKKLFLIFFLLLAYAVVLGFVGFIIATPFMFMILMQLLNAEGFQPWPKVIIISIVLTAFIYIAFAKGFQVSLPKGSLF